jgi:hypothetical protein
MPSLVLGSYPEGLRRVTYQLTMCGCDGMLVASDRREISMYQTATVATTNDVVKVRISPDGKFAWAYSGNEIAPIYAKRVAKAFEDTKPISDEDVKKLLANAGLPAIREWQETASGPLPPMEAVIVMASGATKRIFRSFAKPTTVPEEMMGGLCITGQTANWAAFLPKRFYSQSMSIDELLWLAASSIRMAHDFDSFSVDRLDVAIYRDSSGGFELINGDSYWDEATKLSEKFDTSIRRTLREHATGNRTA